MTSTTQFSYAVGKRLAPIRHISTLRDLSIWILTKYMENENKTYEDTALYLIELVDSELPSKSYYEAAPLFAHIIGTKYTLYKDYGARTLSQRQKNQIIFIISKLIKEELTKYVCR